MSEITTIVPVSPSDAELVRAHRAGQREAFTSIVRRYQRMIWGVIYSHCGDVDKSEDAAQETFIAAWRGIGSLREEAKLGAWLRGIARHVARDAAHPRDGAAPLEAAASITSREPGPERRAVSREEAQTLWNALRRLPEPYRETLVLYYQQEQSTAQVAAAMEITEDAVRQRLARGRQMLREDLTQLVEEALSHVGPRPEFPAVVIAALPGALLPAIRCASVPCSFAAGKSLGAGSVLAWLGPALGFAGGIFSTWTSIREARSPRERRELIRFAVGLWSGVGLFIVFMIVLAANSHRLAPEQVSSIAMLSTSVFFLGCIGAAVLMTRRIEWIRDKENALGESPPPRPRRMLLGIPTTALVAFVSLVVGGMSAAISLAVAANDHSAMLLVVSIAALLLLTGGWALRAWGDRAIRVVLLAGWFCVYAVMLFLLYAGPHGWNPALAASSAARDWPSHLLVHVVGVGTAFLLWFCMRRTTPRGNMPAVSHGPPAA